MTFAVWLQRQLGRDDSVGRIAKYVEDTRDKVEDLSTYGARLTQVITACHSGWSPNKVTLDEMKAAYREYRRHCRYVLKMFYERISCLL